MEIVNLAIIAVFAIFVLAGVYKGFLWNLAALGATIVSLLIALIFMRSMAKLIVANQSLYSAMLSYTEGKEDIYDVDLVNRDITTLTNAEIDEIMERSNLPFPFMQRVHDNILSEALKDRGITTLGDYFNESKVIVFINIISFIIIYMISRILLTVLISWLDYSELPEASHTADRSDRGRRGGLHKGTYRRFRYLHDNARGADGAPLRSDPGYDNKQHARLLPV